MGPQRRINNPSRIKVLNPAGTWGARSGIAIPLSTPSSTFPQCAPEATCGDTILRGTIMISCVSARVSVDWGTCIFISSPSKSALYGEVTERFSLKVEYGRMRTLCPCRSTGCR